MTRINTNVSSLNAQKTLARSNVQLQEALTRLSTGLRINKGKDDPAGLIASEVLRSDIISTQRAVTNSERANQLIATADSALGQVSALLNDIRGLVSEAANEGALSTDQIAANQLQIDSSLEAIDRIAQITSFQGKRLLDGSLDFITTGVDVTQIQGLKIDQANFGTQNSIGVTVQVVQQAARGSLNFNFGAISTDVSLQIGGKNGAEAFNFAQGSTIEEIATAVNLVSDATGVQATVEQEATQGAITASSFGTDNDVLIQADTAGEEEGDIRVKYSKGDSTGTVAVYTAATGNSPATLDVQLQTRAYESAVATVNDSDSAPTDAVYRLVQAGANNDLDLTITSDGSIGAGITVSLNNAATLAAGTNYNATTKTLTIGTSDQASATALAANAPAVINALTGIEIQVSLAVASTDTTGGTNSGAGANATATNIGYATTEGRGTSDNALTYTATIKGAQFNNATVNYVNDALLDNGVALTAGNERITYNHDAQKSSASINTSIANTDLIITADQAGAAYNNVQVLFTDSGAVTGNAATATYNASAKTLTLDIDGGTTDANAVLAAINTEGTFAATLDTTAGANTGAGVLTAAEIAARGGRFGNTGYSGGDAGTLYVYVQEGRSTANNIITSLGAVGNAAAGELFSVARTVDNDGSGVVASGTFSNVFQDGVTGGDVIATANDVVDAINDNATAAALLTAQKSAEDTGFGTVSEFVESSYYGTASANNRLQFLGPEDSRNIRFVANSGQALGVDLITDPQVTAQSKTTLTSANANASLVFSAVAAGKSFDDYAIRFRAAATGAQDRVTYDEETTAATADLNLTGTNNNLRITSTERGEDFNDVNVVLTASLTTGTATAAYDASSKTLTLNIRSDNSTTGAQLQAAINTEGTFSAAANYANRTGDTEAANTLAGTIAATNASATLADTGSTGGHNGSLTFYVANGTTAEQVRSLLQNDAYANKTFFATHYQGSTGAGTIDFATDNNKLYTSGGIASEGTLIVNLETNANGVVQTTANDLIEYFDDAANSATLASLGISISNAEGSNGTGKLAATLEDADLEFATTGTETINSNASLTTSAVNGLAASITLTAVLQGEAYNGVTVAFNNNPLLTGGGDEGVSYDALSKVLTVDVKAGVSTAQHVIDAINADTEVSELFTAAAAGAGTGFVTIFDTGTSSGGTTTDGEPAGTALLGNSDLSDTGLTFQSTTYGSDAFVSVKALGSNPFVLTDADGEVAERSVGTDILARINGIQAVGQGLKASINTSSLDISFNIADTVENDTTIQFEITGGGAQFQLGPDVVSNQQVRLGIAGVNTATIGGVNGKLFELRSGGAKSLGNNVNGAAAVIDEVITAITSLRGRLGAFQKTTLETNIITLNDTLEALTEAESSIRDADFAAESARLTRAQILVQSGTAVLSIANQNPQNALSLLR
ncbi:MAG: flagellin [Planctomycetia bacterium]|nr:flagellin [Planctomycetia bacterium]